MIVHPDLHALRGDDSPQRDAQKGLLDSLSDWRAIPEIALILDDLGAFSRCTPFEHCKVLAQLFNSGNADFADQFVRSFVQAITVALAQSPLGHVPLRHYYDDVLSTIMIDRKGAVTLSITAIDGAALSNRPDDSAVRFCPKETWEVIISGQAVVKQISRFNTDLPHEFQVSSTMLKPGTAQYRNELYQSQILEKVTGILIVLRLQRNQPSITPVQEFDLATGQLVNQTAARSRDSRHEMMMALLGRMQREEAAPIMADMALEQSSTALRWQSVRECLALDTALGFHTLSQIASQPDDPLMQTARALHQQLITAYPQLRELEPCPM